MNDVTVLTQDESAWMDQDRLGNLFDQMGAAHAEELMCRAVEELAVRLTHANRLYREQDLEELGRMMRSLIAISEQIGLAGLGLVADHVRRCIADGDRVALAATMARLMRMGERSLTAVWDVNDVSV